MTRLNVLSPLHVADTAGYGYIDPHALDELWFHTGTACNLSCSFCLEGSKPGDTRLQRITLNDVKPFIDEAITLDVKQFSFTGGEPFIVKDFLKILDYASQRRPCLILTNGTDPLIKRINKINGLLTNPSPVSFRISLDYPDKKRHDAERGLGNFDKALQGMKLLHQHGFNLSVARQMKNDENKDIIENQYQLLFNNNGLPSNISITAFPDFAAPKSNKIGPVITEQCMTKHTDQSRKGFMCAFSKMIVKQNGKMRVYACTLVDDDPFYDLGSSLIQSMEKRVYLKHHRCYSCFTHGSTCSELLI